ncbi:MAG: inositol monophosphatase family protein [Candidatus Roizmanbacteria bacterium]|nr:inositol monophosphatase family protein [Candidatus Roizmanbacteria bacterium]
MMFDLQSLANDVKPRILEAGEMIKDAWDNHQFVTHLKDERDIVTETDTEVEEYLRKALYRILPQAGFIVEEGKTEMLGEYNWTIDPIDGTKYFATQVPLFFTQVALLKNNEPIVSFIYNPVSKQMFQAIKGLGASINDVKVGKREELPLSSSIVHFDLGPTFGAINEWKFELFQSISQLCYRTRVTAGYLAPYLPLGVVDISINTSISTPYSNKNITDLAPHKLFLLESGYNEQLIDYKGHSVLIWASKDKVKQVAKTLQNA